MVSSGARRRMESPVFLLAVRRLVGRWSGGLWRGWRLRGLSRRVGCPADPEAGEVSGFFVGQQAGGFGGWMSSLRGVVDLGW